MIWIVGGLVVWCVILTAGVIALRIKVERTSDLFMADEAGRVWIDEEANERARLRGSWRISKPENA